MLKLVELPNPKQFRKTPSGYSYNEPDINIKCNFKGTEPSPKGFGLCARMVLEGDRAKGTDGNIWIKKGGRWVKIIRLDRFQQRPSKTKDKAKSKVKAKEKDKVETKVKDKSKVKTKVKTKVETKVELPNPKQFRKTPSGYSYNEPDINVTCNFKGTEPSPKGFGLCAKMVLEGAKGKGTDGNVWVKKGSRWIKDKTFTSVKAKVISPHSELPL